MKQHKSALWYLYPTPLYTWLRLHRGCRTMSTAERACGFLQLGEGCVDAPGRLCRSRRLDQQLYIRSSVGRGHLKHGSASCPHKPNWIAKYSNLQVASLPTVLAAEIPQLGTHIPGILPTARVFPCIRSTFFSVFGTYSISTCTV